MKYDVTPLGGGHHIVRFVTCWNPYHYDRGIVVTEEEFGTVLKLQLFLGKSLSPQQWRQAGAFLFPSAVAVRFERWCPRRQEFRDVYIGLNRHSKDGQ